VDYLGPDRESIGREKAGIMRAHRPVVVSDPVPPASVVERAAALGADLRLAGRDFRHSGDRQQWAWAGRSRRYHALAYPALRGANQLLNASGALAALEALGDRLPVSAQAVRQGLAAVDLPGRFQVLPGQPAVILDVAHNDQSAAALALNLDQLGFASRTQAVFGAMRDKDLPALIRRLLPLVDFWHLCDLPLPRAATAVELAEALRDAAPDAAFALHAGPALALAAAHKAADPADRIIVYGSFLTVGGVLKAVLEAKKPGHQGAPRD
jgi:dihydrofolate synthase/folylpolyglutamate synthase